MGRALDVIIEQTTEEDGEEEERMHGVHKPLFIQAVENVHSSTRGRAAGVTRSFAMSAAALFIFTSVVRFGSSLEFVEVSTLDFRLCYDLNT